MSLPVALAARLRMQGFACDHDPLVARLEPWLRWTPGLSTIWILAGTVLREPGILLAFSLVAGLGAAGWHPLDALFNGVVRHLQKLPALPHNPAPRRFAMAVAAAWSAMTAILYAAGYLGWGLAAGLLLAAAALLVASTHFCLGSWVWHRLGLGRSRSVEKR
jgi:hypothetical protein